MSIEKIRILALVTDAFGGHGGIAQYNRHLLTALASHECVTEVVAIPRLMPHLPETLPSKLGYITDALEGKEYVAQGLIGKLKYILTVLRLLGKKPGFDFVICGHINLLPVARLAQMRAGAPMLLIIHGVDAWNPSDSWLVNFLARRVRHLASVSDVTLKRFLSWSESSCLRSYILPNAIDSRLFGTGEKSPVLLDRYGLTGKKVLMTFGRLVSTERAKGFDKVLELLPELRLSIPDLAYLIVGGGEHRERLIRKARDLGVADLVVFAGMIPEGEKADHYRLADVFVMPSRGEGFGIVFLEAMACGIPVIASNSDGGREAVRDGLLGTLINPDDRDGIKQAIMKALVSGSGKVPEGLSYFEFSNFEKRVHQTVETIVFNRE